MNLTREHFSILRLIRTQNIGPQTFWRLMALAPSAVTLLENWSEVQSKIRRKLELACEKTLTLEVEKTFKKGAQFLFYSDPYYPLSFQSVSDRPPVLTYKGDLSFLNQKKAKLRRK